MPKFEILAKFIQITVQGTMSDREKRSEKPPNPRRGTSLKEKLVKTIGLKDKTYLKIEQS